MSNHIILHGRRLRLSPRQAQRLSLLLAHAGRLVSGKDLQLAAPAKSQAALARAISRMREAVHPHGYTIYPVPGYGFMLVEEEAPCR